MWILMLCFVNRWPRQLYSQQNPGTGQRFSTGSDPDTIKKSGQPKQRPVRVCDRQVGGGQLSDVHRRRHNDVIK